MEEGVRRAPPMWAVAIVVTVAAAGVGSAAWATTWVSAPPTGAAPGGIRAVHDLTPQLGPTFHPGAIQGFGYNDSLIFLAGISVWDKPAESSQPVLASLDPHQSVVNLTPSVAREFADGGVFGSVWNGSAWLLSGEVTWGSLNEGVL